MKILEKIGYVNPETFNTHALVLIEDNGVTDIKCMTVKNDHRSDADGISVPVLSEIDNLEQVYTTIDIQSFLNGTVKNLNNKEKLEIFDTVNRSSKYLRSKGFVVDHMYSSVAITEDSKPLEAKSYHIKDLDTLEALLPNHIYLYSMRSFTVYSSTWGLPVSAYLIRFAEAPKE